MVTRTTLFLAVGLALYLGPQAGAVSAKECLADIVYAPDPPVAGQETMVTFSSLNLEHESRDPDCAFGAAAGVEPVATLYVAGPGSGFSVDLQKLNPWQYRASVTFPMEGSWELSFGRSYLRSETGLLSEQNRFSVDVLSSAALPSAGAGFGDRGAGAPTNLLAYALAAAGGAALCIGGLTRIVGRRSSPPFPHR